MNKALGIKITSVVILIIMILALVGFLLISVPYEDPNRADASEPIIIEQGDSAITIAQKLQDQGLIKGTTLFTLYVRLTGNNSELKAGSYVLEDTYSIRELVAILSNGIGGHTDITVTIPEGSTVDDIDRIFAESGFLARGSLRQEILDQEGYLFPDTYRFAEDTLPGDLINRLQQTFIDRVGFDVSEEQVIIASMLEREVRSDEDMRLVAGIMYKRMEIGMPLQIDATVAYGVCRDRWEAGRNCTPALVNLVDNIPRDTSYNTYTRAELPAGPIANPGLRALEAAANPEASEYLFYLSKKDGETVFSETLDQHNAARNKYILNQ